MGHRWWASLTATSVGSKDPDTFNGVPILVRYTWTVNPRGLPATAIWEQALNSSGSPVVAKWEQAFSKNGGKTWETKWYNEFIHDDNYTPTS